jgi:hypothetical protein
MLVVQVVLVVLVLLVVLSGAGGPLALALMVVPVYHRVKRVFVSFSIIPSLITRVALVIATSLLPPCWCCYADRLRQRVVVVSPGIWLAAG